MQVRESKASTKAVRPAAQSKAVGPDSTRERILAGAERLFAEQGFNGATMPMIASASGITAGAIYKHFDSKAGLFFEVVQRAVRAMSTPVPAGEPSGVAAIAEIVANYVTPKFKPLRQVAVEVHYAAARDPKVRHFLRRSLQFQIGQLRDGVAAGQAAGDLDAAASPDLVANGIFVFIMGLMHMETLAPQLIGDAEWQAFIADRLIRLMGAPTAGAGADTALTPNSTP